MSTVAKTLRIKFATAKHILSVFRKNGKVLAKKSKYKVRKVITILAPEEKLVSLS